MNKYVARAHCYWKGHDLDLLKFYPGNAHDFRCRYFCRRCEGYYYHKDEKISSIIVKCPTCNKESCTEIWIGNVSTLSENGTYNYYPKQKSLRSKCCGTKLIEVFINNRELSK